jgi:hypothetical protein
MSKSGLPEQLESVLISTPWVGLPDDELDELARLVAALRDAVDGEKRHRAMKAWTLERVAS